MRENEPTMAAKGGEVPFVIPRSKIERDKRREQSEADDAAAKKELAKQVKRLNKRDESTKKVRINVQAAAKKKKKEQAERLKEEKFNAKMLLPEQTGTLVAEDGEETYEISQKDIVDAVDIRAAGKAFDLNLDEFGPYFVDYTQSGKHLVLAGSKGHIATMEWDSKTLVGEYNLKKAVRDVKFLHTHSMVAVAQKKHAYIYDDQGVEVHVLKKHNDVLKLEYLPYHFLLCSLNARGALMYQDVSTGLEVALLQTKSEFARVMKQNPQNAILHVGHNSGAITMWSPNNKEPVVKLLAHKAPVASIAVNIAGNYMASAGQDSHMHIYDIRTWTKAFTVKRYNVPHTMEFSQKDILAVASGSEVQMWQHPFDINRFSLYMQHTVPDGKIHSLKYCPYEDILGVGHTKGFTSLLIPGAGEANVDTSEANPLQTKKQAANHLVKSLMEKVPSDMIALNPEGFAQLHDEMSTMTDEERIRSSHPGFVRFRTSNKADTPYHVKLLEREKRKMVARKVEEGQKEKGAEEKKRKKTAKEEDALAPALQRFTKKKK